MKKTLRFKSGHGLREFTDRDGFVWLAEHTKDKDEEYADLLLKKLPKNFELIPSKEKEAPKKPKEDKEKKVDDQPDKSIKKEKTKTK